MGRSSTAWLWRRTSVRHNFSANLASKLLSALVSLACVPVYLRVLGVGGYGLVGIWTMLETFANLLDLGLSPTMTREMAAASGRREGAEETRDLVRTLEVGYWAIGVAIGAMIMLGASPIAHYWLRSAEFSTAQLRTTVVLIGALILCRWPLSFYAGGLSGLERQVLLSWVGLAFACLRSLGAVLVLLFVSPTIVAFFLWQIIVSLANSATLALLLWRCLPRARGARFLPSTLRRIWKFAGGITAVALISILLTDLDKLVVSKLLSLEDFGYYSLGGRIAASLSMASAPVFSALFPAFSRLVAARDDQRQVELYHRGAQLMSVLVVPAAVTVAFFSKPLIFAWTGNQLIADRTALVAALLIGGSAFNSIILVPYSLQVAHGWTSLAFWTNAVYATVTVPLLIVLTNHFGPPGAAFVWLIINFSYLATQVPLMHRRLLRSEARRWYVEDVGMPLVSCVATAILVAALITPPATRLGAWATVALAGILIGAAGVLATPLGRKQVRTSSRLIWRTLTEMRP
jgi:O-antigen/teichoic acid export membrane protein